MSGNSSVGRGGAGSSLIPPDPLHPGLPAVEEPAEVVGVHGLLDEQVDLPPHTEHGALLHPLQLLLQPQQHPLGHLVEALAVAAHRHKEEKEEEKVMMLTSGRVFNHVTSLTVMFMMFIALFLSSWPAE